MYYLPYIQQGNWYPPRFGHDYRQYKPVTAYTVDRPVYVNNVDINKFPYQALNYQPTGVQYPYIYVPIAQFSKVGAQVKWDDQTQTLSVTTDYFTMRDELAACKESLKGCMTSLKTQMAEHPPSNPLDKLTDQQLHDMILPYIVSPEKGWSVSTEKAEDEKKFGTINIEHIQPGTIYDPPGASLNLSQELLDKLTNAYGYPVRLEIGNRHFTNLVVYKY
jgi:hypothetical protein